MADDDVYDYMYLLSIVCCGLSGGYAYGVPAGTCMGACSEARENVRILRVPRLLLLPSGAYTHTQCSTQYAVRSEQRAVSFLLPPVHLTCAKHTAAARRAVLWQYAAAIASGAIFTACCSQLRGGNPNNDVISGFPKHVFSRFLLRLRCTCSRYNVNGEKREDSCRY